MKLRRIMIASLLTGTLVVAASVPTWAKDGQDDSPEISEDSPRARSETRQGRSSDDMDRSEEGESSVTSRDLSGDDNPSPEDRLERQKELIEQRREKLEAKLEARKAERKEKLEGRRLARCENREARINQLLDDSAARAQKRLEMIQGYEEGIKGFYENRQLTHAGYDDAVKAADDAESAVIAATQTMKDMNFECDDVDTKSPAADIRVMAATRHDALKGYRMEVKDLLQVVKAAYGDSVTDEVEGN